MASSPFCFVMMPFRPELHFFYLFTQRHLEDHHNLKVERGDHEILTIPLVKKIEDQITRADFIIADVTGNNPNVFYELGIAHSQAKPAVLITQDEVEKIPVDLRPFEVIRYSLAEHISFFSKLDSAVNSILRPRYTELFIEAEVLLTEFNKKTGVSHEALDETEFTNRVSSALIISQLPPKEELFARAAFLLPKILAHTDDFNLMARITEYLNATQTPPG